MAKRSPEAKAATARNQQRKGKATAAVKAKAATILNDMSAEANAQIDNNVIQLQPGSANAVIKPENAFDLSIPLSAPVDPRTADNKPHLRMIEPTEEQLSTANKLADYGAIDFDNALSSFKAVIAGAQWQAHVLAVAVAIRIQREGEKAIPLAQKFIDAVSGVAQRFTMVRVNAVEAWLLHYAPVKWDADQKEYRLDKPRHRNEAGKFGTKKDAWIKERVSHPFFMFKPAPTLQEYNFLDSIQAQIDKAKRILAMDKSARDSRYKKVELEGLEALEKTMRLLENKAADDKVEVAA